MVSVLGYRLDSSFLDKLGYGGKIIPQFCNSYVILKAAFHFILNACNI